MNAASGRLSFKIKSPWVHGTYVELRLSWEDADVSTLTSSSVSSGKFELQQCFVCLMILMKNLFLPCRQGEKSFCVNFARCSGAGWSITFVPRVRSNKQRNQTVTCNTMLSLLAFFFIIDLCTYEILGHGVLWNSWYLIMPTYIRVRPSHYWAHLWWEICNVTRLCYLKFPALLDPRWGGARPTPLLFKLAI